MAKLPVTVVIPVRNEERNLPGCLERLGRFERVVVLDSGSTDRTAAIARTSGAKVLEFRWNGQFPKKRNWYLRNHRVETPWVFFLDADEFVDDRFCDELERTLPGTEHVGFWINYTNWFMGRELRHGDANRKLALFRVGSGEYERIKEDSWSNLDMEVHEHPVLSGTVGEIGARIDHRDYRGLGHWFQKHNDYSAWEARRLIALRHDGLDAHPELTSRQLSKYRSIGKWWFPATYFSIFYLAKRGFLDGYPGFVYACCKSVYFWQIGLKALEAESTTSAPKGRSS
jgi:glycosyltransferase involved in cell wall biosynthesis